ncbi:hypothetical protein IMZ48_18755 [Candidatus Bathyarchaeota archaeon]|nr:hypothetical protein [Candidatus Bathyarchaeota archaeon]
MLRRQRLFDGAPLSRSDSGNPTDRRPCHGHNSVSSIRIPSMSLAISHSATAQTGFNTNTMSTTTLASHTHDLVHRGSSSHSSQNLALEDRFEVLKEIGDGSFGSVVLARVRGAGSSVARRGTVVS